MARERVYTIEASYDLGGAGLLCAASRKMVTRPSGDTPPDTPFGARIRQPVWYSIQAFDKGLSTSGPAQVGFGTVKLIATDGKLDALAEAAFNGYPFIARTGRVGDAYPDDFITVFQGVSDRVEWSLDDLTLSFKDSQAILLQPLLTRRFTGGNALPNGLEGVAGDLKDKMVPCLYGRRRRVTAVCVNTDRFIYCMSVREMSAVIDVEDRGAPFLAGAPYSSQADMESNLPAVGYYRAWLPAGGPSYFRLRAKPDGQVTFSGEAAGTAADWSVAKILRQMAIDAGISAGNIDAGDVSALHSANSAVTGCYVQDQTGAAAMKEIADSIGAGFYIDPATNMLRMGQLTAPGGTSVEEIGAKARIIEIERVASDDDGFGVPCWRVELSYQKYDAVQGEIAAAVSGGRANELKQQYRTVSHEDAAIKTRWPKAPVLKVVTAIDDATAAQNECDRVFDLRSALRAPYRIKARLPRERLPAVLPFACVTVQHPRFGMSAGKQLRVLGIAPDLGSEICELRAWG